MTMFSITADDKTLYQSIGTGPLGEIHGETFEETRNITVTPNRGECEHRCKRCGRELAEYPGKKFSAEDAGPWTDECPDSEDFGPHEPEFIPLSWMDSAQVDIDEGQDSVTVTIVVDGSPLALAIHRVNDKDHENYGKLVVLAPYTEMQTELPLRTLQRGSFLVNFK